MLYSAVSNLGLHFLLMSHKKDAYMGKQSLLNLAGISQ